MKKIVVLVLTLLLIFALAACTDNKNTEETDVFGNQTNVPVSTATLESDVPQTEAATTPVETINPNITLPDYLPGTGSSSNSTPSNGTTTDDSGDIYLPIVPIH